MTDTTLSYIVWGLVGLIFAAVEVLPLTGRVRWHTLSETIWNLEAKSHWVAIAIVAGLAVLVVHIVFGKSGPAS